MKHARYEREERKKAKKARYDAAPPYLKTRVEKGRRLPIIVLKGEEGGDEGVVLQEVVVSLGGITFDKLIDMMG